MYLELTKALFGCFILLALTLLQFWGAKLFFKKVIEHLCFYRDAQKVMGDVIAPVKGFDSEGDTVFQTRYSYEVEGKEYLVTDDLLTNWRGHKKGSTVQVYYLLSNPEDGRLAHPTRPFLYSLFAALMAGTGCLIVTLFIKYAFFNS